MFLNTKLQYSKHFRLIAASPSVRLILRYEYVAAMSCTWTQGCMSILHMYANCEKCTMHMYPTHCSLFRPRLSPRQPESQAGHWPRAGRLPRGRETGGHRRRLYLRIPRVSRLPLQEPKGRLNGAPPGAATATAQGGMVVTCYELHCYACYNCYVTTVAITGWTKILPCLRL